MNDRQAVVVSFFFTVLALVGITVAIILDPDVLPADSDSTLAYLVRSPAACPSTAELAGYCAQDFSVQRQEARTALNYDVAEDNVPDADLVAEIFGELPPRDLLPRYSTVARAARKLRGALCTATINGLATDIEGAQFVNQLVPHATGLTGMRVHPMYDAERGVIASLAAPPPARALPAWLLHPAVRRSDSVFFGAVAQVLRDRTVTERLRATYGTGPHADEFEAGLVIDSYALCNGE